MLAHGLIGSSFVPPAPIRALRDLTRTRKQLVGEIVRHTLRIQKTLEDANLKLTHVVSDMLGTSGRAILRALIAGETDPERLAALATVGWKRPPPGRHAGLSETAARVLVAEIGTDMRRFPTAGHLVPWAGPLSAARHQCRQTPRHATRLRHAPTRLKTTLIQGARGATRKKGSYLHTQYVRLKSRRGPKKAIVAVAASTKRLLRRLRDLGVVIELKAAQSAAFGDERLYGGY